MIEEYLKFIIQQYYGKPNAMAEMTLITKEFEKVFNILNDFVNQFDLDKATGDRLDLIGKIVGISRIVEDGIPKEYFSFLGNPLGKGFGKGSFFRGTTDSGFSPTELNDNQYQFFIKAKIAKNISKAVMVSDDKDSIQDAVTYLFDSNAYVIDNQDMTLTIYVDSIFNENEVKFLRSLNLLPKPQGVRYKALISFSSTATFGFSNNVNAKSFGQGRFARGIN